MSNNPQAVPYGTGDVWVTLVELPDGTKVTPRQTRKLPAIQDLKFDDKMDSKEMHGGKARALHIAGGKRQTSGSFSLGEAYGRLLNTLCYGESPITQKKRRIVSEKITVPVANAVQLKIRNNVTFNLSRSDSVTGVTINGSAAALVTTTTPQTLQYKYASGQFQFSVKDTDKPLVVTWVSNGITVVSTLTVPTSLAFDIRQFEKNISVKNDTTALTKDATFSLVSAPPASGHFQSSANGVYVFNSDLTVATGKFLTVAHKTDGMTVSSTIAAAQMPTAGYISYIDPPTAALFVANVDVALVTDSGTAMTGVAAGELLTSIGSGTPATSEYKNTIDCYTFAAADTGDTVLVRFTTDYQVVKVNIPDGADFIADKGITTLSGMPYDHVAVTSPLSLAVNQYAVTNNGSYYFDVTANGKTINIDYEIEEDGGFSIDMVNQTMGQAPRLQLDIQAEEKGKIWKMTLLNVMPKGMSFDKKIDDRAYYQFEFVVAIDQDTDSIGQVSGSTY